MNQTLYCNKSFYQIFNCTNHLNQTFTCTKTFNQTFNCDICCTRPLNQALICTKISKQTLNCTTPLNQFKGRKEGNAENEELTLEEIVIVAAFCLVAFLVSICSYLYKKSKSNHQQKDDQGLLINEMQ